MVMNGAANNHIADARQCIGYYSFLLKSVLLTFLVYIRLFQYMYPCNVTGIRH